MSVFDPSTSGDLEWDEANEAAHDAWEWEQLRDQADRSDARRAVNAGEW